MACRWRTRWTGGTNSMSMRWLVWWRWLMSPRCTGRGRIRWDANGWSMSIHDGVRRCSREWWRHALTIALDFVSQHFDFSAHVLVALLECDNEVDGYEAYSETLSGGIECKAAYLC